MNLSACPEKIAFCPKCDRAMGVVDSACPHCGYDFAPDRAIRRPGIAHSRFADLVLVLGAIAAGIGSILVAFAAANAILHGNLAYGLVGGPLMFFFLLAAMVVFLRMQDRWHER